MQAHFSPFETEILFTIESESDFISCFRDKDQKKLIAPPNLKFPMRIRSYFTWRESSGTYTYLVFKLPNWDLPRGIVFKRRSALTDGGGRICGWCHSYGSSDEINMMSVAINGSTSSGYILCEDLRCIEKIEEAAALSGKSPEKHIQQLYQKIGLFFENLGNYRPD